MDFYSGIFLALYAVGCGFSFWGWCKDGTISLFMSIILCLLCPAWLFFAVLWILFDKEPWRTHLILEEERKKIK